MLTEAKVLASTEDMSVRALDVWHLIDHGAQGGGPAVDSDHRLPPARAISELNLSLLRFATTLRGYRGAERDAFLMDVASKPSAHTPSASEVKEAVFLEEACTAEEFVDIFCGNVEVDLDEESVFPLPSGPVF